MKEFRLSRRALLRGLLAAGSAWCLPRLGLAGAGKLSKEQARYQDRPNGEQKCANCRNFLPPSACTVVEGTVSPDGWCVLWAKKD